MERPTSTIATSHWTACPVERIELELPLATIEELDNLATRDHLGRDQVLRAIIDAALCSDTPQRPAGPDPLERLAHRAFLTRLRSVQLARGRAES